MKEYKTILNIRIKHSQIESLVTLLMLSQRCGLSENFVVNAAMVASQRQLHECRFPSDIISITDIQFIDITWLPGSKLLGDLMRSEFARGTERKK